MIRPNPDKQMLSELPTEIYDKIRELSARGDGLARSKLFVAALQNYEEAWDLLPEPKTNWNASTWLLTAIGDVHFFRGSFDKTVEVLTNAILNTPGALGNPFLHLRRGQSLLELGRKDEAADELMRAYMGAGSDIFKSEDAKYLEFLKTRAQL